MELAADPLRNMNPRRRGWLVTIYGDNPHYAYVNPESNPYNVGTSQWREYLIGRKFGRQYKANPLTSNVC